MVNHINGLHLQWFVPSMVYTISGVHLQWFVPSMFYTRLVYTTYHRNSGSTRPRLTTHNLRTTYVNGKQKRIACTKKKRQKVTACLKQKDVDQG